MNFLNGAYILVAIASPEYKIFKLIHILPLPFTLIVAFSSMIIGAGLLYHKNWARIGLFIVSLPLNLLLLYFIKKAGYKFASYPFQTFKDPYIAQIYASINSFLILVILFTREYANDYFKGVPLSPEERLSFKKVLISIRKFFGVLLLLGQAFCFYFILVEDKLFYFLLWILAFCAVVLLGALLFGWKNARKLVGWIAIIESFFMMLAPEVKFWGALLTLFGIIVLIWRRRKK